MDTYGVQQHVNQVVVDMGNLFRGSINTPLILANLVGIVALSLASVIEFNKHNTHDIASFTDAAFRDSPAFVTDLPFHATYLIDPKTTAIDDMLCAEDDHLCVMSHVSPLTLSHSGVVSNQIFDITEQSMHVTHMIWVVSWFITPISLFLFANANWFSFEQWMWWLMYVFIFSWNAIGLIFMLFEAATPVYNAVFAILYCAFSTMLILSVREAWKVVTNDGSEKAQIFTSAASSLKSKIPKLMQVSLVKAQPSYLLAGSSEAQTSPIEIRYIYSQTALVVTELFFLVPILYLVATVMVQYRVTPFELQARYWVSTLFFGSLVLMEKSRRVGVTYMTDVCLIAFAIATTISLGFFFIADLIVVMTRAVAWAPMFIFFILFASQFVGICLIGCNIFLASMMSKQVATMTQTQENDRSSDVKRLEGIEKMTFQATLLLLIVSKFIMCYALLNSLIKVA